MKIWYIVFRNIDAKIIFYSLYLTIVAYSDQNIIKKVRLFFLRNQSVFSWRISD